MTRSRSPSAPDAAATRAASSGRQYVSARDVAEKAGVSRSAVSRALTPGASVSPETKAKVLAAAEALGYEINLLARGLLDARSGIVSLVGASLGSPFMNGLLPVVTARLLEGGYAPMVINIGRDSERAEDSLRLALQLRSSAIVVLSGLPSSRFVGSALQSGVPVIALNRDDEGPDLIVADNAGAGAEAFGVLQASGAARLVVVAPERWTSSMRARAGGFMEAAKAVGATPRLVMASAEPQDSGTLDYRAGRNAAAAVFATGERPDGVFCLNDHTAFGVMDGARYAYGLEPGEHFALVGFDDVPTAAWDSFQLSTFRQDPARLADTIVEVLERRREVPSAPAERIVLPCRYVERRSSALCAARPRPPRQDLS